MPLAFFFDYIQFVCRFFTDKKNHAPGVVSLFLSSYFFSASLYTVAIASKFGPFWPAAMIW